MRAFAFVIAFACFACGSNHRPPSVSFYYWKTIFRLNDIERSTLRSNKVDKIYIRYFDIALQNGKPVPVSPIIFEERPEQEIVPVIYIKNEVMLAPTLDIKSLAKNVTAFIEQINAGKNIQPSSLQVDCDWTLKSKDMYFKFIEKLKDQTKLTLSATIRLHQVKHFTRTGVPPVARGTLMYYNMGRIGSDSSNSVYDGSIARQYIYNMEDYPLPLDIALPVFSWGIHIRQSRVVGLLSKVDTATFRHDSIFVAASGNLFTVAASGERQGRYFQKGDQVKIESISEANLKEMTSDLAKHLAKPPAEVIFYDLDQFNLSHFKDEKIYSKVSAGF